ncbi:MAG TPA: hypothetical protein VG675_04130 [Bryobacteraceae bacterium]|nr:hypothetical protein [Bryobacteraceae bacterium]
MRLKLCAVFGLLAATGLYGETGENERKQPGLRGPLDAATTGVVTSGFSLTGNVQVVE